MFYIIGYLFIRGTIDPSRRTEVAETVKERLMKVYQADMDRQAEKQRQRNQRRAAYPIIAILASLVLAVLAVLFIGLC
jgi:hypothetical protein